MSYFTRTEGDSKSLNELAAEIHELNKSKGFWSDNRDPADVLMLIVTEASEAMEAIRDAYPLGENRFEAKVGPDGKVYPKPVGVPSEMADILIRTLDACAAWGIDIDEIVRLKLEYNAGREYMHGRVR